MYKLFFKSLIVFLLIIFNYSAYGQDDKDISKWEPSIGIKGDHSAGLSKPNFYLDSYGGIKYSINDFSAFLKIDDFFHYQLLDGNGNFINVNIFKFNTGVSYIFFKDYGISFDLSYLTGESEYHRINLGIELSMDINKFSFVSDYKRSFEMYHFRPFNINLTYDDFSFEIDYILSKNFIFDLLYTFSSTLLERRDKFLFIDEASRYNLHLFRTGFISKLFNSLYLLGGLRFSFDSINYLIYGFDFITKVEIGKHFSISLKYIFSYYNSGNIKKPEELISQPGPLVHRPETSDSFPSHQVSFGLNISF